MRHSFLDKYSDGGSFIHRLDPRTKLLTTFIFIAAVVLTPPGQWTAFALFLAVVVVWLALSRVPLGYVLKRSLLIIPFVLLIAAFVPFFKEGEVAGSANIWGWQVSVTSSGLILMGSILAKSWVSILSLIILTATTSLPDMLKGLEQLKMPKVMVMLLSFMYRYIFVLTDEVMRLKQARDSRNFGGRRLWQMKTVGNMIGILFIRSYERGERVYAAMVARGFDGHSRTIKRLNFHTADAYFGICVVAVVASTSAFSLL